MDKEVTEQLLALLKNANSGISKGLDTVQYQAADLIEQILAWKFISSISVMALFIVSFIVLIILLILENKRANDQDETFFDAPLPYSIPVVIMAVMVIVWLINLSIVGVAWLKILIAPKLYLLEYLNELRKVG